MDITELMKASRPLERSVAKLSIYPVVPCTENTFSNHEFEPCRLVDSRTVIIALFPSIPLH
jgi:hypothetical protein